MSTCQHFSVKKTKNLKNLKESKNSLIVKKFINLDFFFALVKKLNNNDIFLVLPFREINIQQELSNPPRFRIIRLHHERHKEKEKEDKLGFELNVLIGVGGVGRGGKAIFSS